MKVLVIGGSRFTGRFVVEKLVDLGHNVTVLNRGKSDKKIDALYLESEEYIYPKSVSIINIDRTNAKELHNFVSGKDFEAIIDTCAFNEKDIQGVLDLKLEKLENYVFVSTGSVYEEEVINILPITEDATIGSMEDDFPIPYTRDKRRAEALLKKAYLKYNFPMTIFRPTYIYGPFNPIYREFYFFDRIIDEKPIYMPGNGEYLLDFVFTKDLAQLLTSTLGRKNVQGESYNAAGQGGITLNNYVKMLSKIIGKKATVIHYDPNKVVKINLEPENRNQMFPFAYDSHFILSKEKCSFDLNYQPHTLVEGLTETYNWYINQRNPNWNGDYDFDRKLADIL